MSRLELESATDLIDLDPLGPPVEGWFASAGATGFGFPGRKTQWSEGAANGATFRNARELARVFDLPIHGKGANRSAMQTLLSRMAVALADPCTLRFTDAGAAVWELTVVRTGGGDYAYGSDDHQPADDELNIVVTLQTDGDPFWKRVTGQTQAIAKPFGAVSVVNAGDAPSSAVWTVDGPGINLRLQSPSGELLPWNGVLDIGQTLTIDTEARTIVDNLGRNRYGELGAAPRFGALPGGTKTWQVAFDSTSADFTAAFGNTYNYVTNPRFPNLTGWTGSDTILWTPGSAQSTAGSVSANTLRAAVTGGGIQHNRSISITGLTVGKLYRFGAKVQWLRGSTSFGKATQPHLGPAISVGGKSARLARAEIDAAAARIVTVTFVATATTATLVLASGSHKNWNSNSTSIFSEPFLTEGDNGSHFTGASIAAGGATFSWEGTVDASRSIRTVPGAPSNATTKIDVTWNPRRQAVI